MAEVDIAYLNHSFEANPYRVSWVQKFLMSLLKKEPSLEGWQLSMLEEWEINSMTTLYKYIFDEEILDSEAKLIWAREFMSKAYERFQSISWKEFEKIVEDGEIPEFNREKTGRLFEQVIDSLQQPFSN